jgi:hypothetical protein
MLIEQAGGWLGLVAILSAPLGCSAADAAGTGGGRSCDNDAGVSASGAAVWADGTSETSSVSIAPGSTILIAPGATIAMGADVTIAVKGTLVASSACGARARLVWPAGASATSGITVAPGGSLWLDGVDISGAASALNVSGGAAEYDHGTIDGAVTPFLVAAGATLKSIGAAVTRARGQSLVSGSFVASNLDYNSNGNSGILGGDSSTIDIQNSKLHGTGPFADMVMSGGTVGAASIRVQHTEIYQVHCAFHFGPIDTFDIGYTNIHDNAYGFMLYGSGASGGTVSYSNIDVSNSVAFAPAGSNGPITFDHCFMPGGSSSAPVVVTNAESSPIAGAGPM